MARSLNSEEAEVFSLDILATKKFPLIKDSAGLPNPGDSLLEPSAELALWFRNNFPGFLVF